MITLNFKFILCYFSENPFSISKYEARVAYVESTQLFMI